MEYIEIGKIHNTFGIKGQLKVECRTDFPEERYAEGSTVYIGEEKFPLVVKDARFHKGSLLVLFEAHEDINLVEKYKGMSIYKSLEDIEPLEDGYYFRDIEGLDAYVGDSKVGYVQYMEEGTPFNYMRIKKEDGTSSLVPFSDVFVEEVDLENHLVRIVKMEGLL